MEVSILGLMAATVVINILAWAALARKVNRRLDLQDTFNEDTGNRTDRNFDLIFETLVRLKRLESAGLKTLGLTDVAGYGVLPKADSFFGERARKECHYFMAEDHGDSVVFGERVFYKSPSAPHEGFVYYTSIVTDAMLRPVFGLNEW